MNVLKVDRIDHGNRALEDDRLVNTLVSARTTLTICPPRLCVVNDPNDHPLIWMLDIGLKTTVNSDDAAYFGRYLLDNYVHTADALGLTEAEIVTFARNSFAGSFLDAETKSASRARFDKAVALASSSVCLT